MSKSSKPSRQEYIVKVRYLNNLPPPPLNPKFLAYNTTENVTNKKEAEYLISSLFRKENFSSLMEQVDEELGMNLNLINNPGFFDDNNDSVIYNLYDRTDKSKPMTLHSKDRALLRDAGIGKISKSEPGVSFLRRTEYIAERLLPKVGSNPASLGSMATPVINSDLIDSDSQLKAVEKTFENSQESQTNFTSLKHPTRKHLKAVATWPLLPDTSMSDTKFLSVKFVGSASIHRELELAKRKEGSAYNEKFQRASIESAILKPITSADGEWLLLYQVKDPKKATEINEKLHSTKREQPVNLLDEDEEVEEFKFKHSKNYEMNFQRFNKANEELALKFVPDGKKRKAAFWYPITGKIDLKKYRALTNSEINRFLKESTVDGINFKLREPNTGELRKMDAIRSEFDPMEYEGEEDE